METLIEDDDPNNYTLRDLIDHALAAEDGPMLWFWTGAVIGRTYPEWREAGEELWAIAHRPVEKPQDWAETRALLRELRKKDSETR